MEAEKLRLKEREGLTNITCAFSNVGIKLTDGESSKCHFLTRSYYAQCLNRAGGPSNRFRGKVSKARGLNERKHVKRLRYLASRKYSVSVNYQNNYY